MVQERRYVGEQVRASAEPFDEIGLNRTPVERIGGQARLPDLDNPLGLLEREWPQQDRVCRGEYPRGRPDPIQ